MKVKTLDRNHAAEIRHDLLAGTETIEYRYFMLYKVLTRKFRIATIDRHWRRACAALDALIAKAKQERTTP